MICTVFPYFIKSILELPLTTSQDYSIFHILGDYSLDLWKRQTALITARNGLMNFIVHPDYIMDDRATSLYKTLLAHLSDLRDKTGVWITRPLEVNQWWRERSQMKLVLEDGEWRIQGQGHERARLAYACLENDRMVCTPAPQN